MANSSPPCAAYRALMACRLVALDKRPGVCTVGIGETLCQALAKLVMREAGEQAKTACCNLQLCAGLKAGIEGATHAMGQFQLDWVRGKRREEEAEDSAEEEEESGGVLEGINNLTIETAVTEEEAAEQQKAVLEMGVEEERGSEGEGGGKGASRALGSLEFLTQDADPSGTTLVDTRNEFNELIRLAMLWTVQHRWLEGGRIAFNCYRHWAQLLLRQRGEPPVTVLGR